MATMARDAWTDERLDDLRGSVDAGFADNREEFRAVRAEIKSGAHALRSEMKSEFLALRGEIGAMNRSIHQLTVSLVGAMLLGFLGTISAIVTQL